MSQSGALTSAASLELPLRSEEDSGGPYPDPVDLSDAVLHSTLKCGGGCFGLAQPLCSRICSGSCWCRDVTRQNSSDRDAEEADIR